ncbi:glycosyltransferase family 2 protein [Methylobacterium aerolatum]|uniref:Glycosyltransferase involved in cell wall biosynthesis n=1 Tax=Methylobacterium aerolatum TaxID=418708 RepID=A0ABU0HTD3_9HYPH|nr:glycosyltransferase [Methylobacterium aerolatum]MDQ0445598.1 glycosyltransferase involved in cell wall biosynthesis [Methylobacterium aerolatum]GJD36291.1 hypothetical protein FMGBMHLM_3208 [Methylobacterium aerolatum]
MKSIRVAVAIATKGRPNVVAQCIASLRDQTYPIDDIIISCSSSDDSPQLTDAHHVRTIYGPVGLTKQRNNALANLGNDIDLVFFFDDDFVAHRDYIKVMVDLFTEDASIAGATGAVIADGINGKAIKFEDAKQKLSSIDVENHKRKIINNFSPYGCNMVFRLAAISGLRFDERLVLYGWQEDRDFGAEVARRGKIVKVSTAYGVHLGFKGGRVAGTRLGYSQVVNPLYLFRKNNMNVGNLTAHISRNFTANAIKIFIFKDGEDRLGRLKGNFMAVMDVIRGKIEPEKVKDL